MYMPKRHEYPTRTLGKKKRKRDTEVQRRQTIIASDNESLGKCIACGRFDFLDNIHSLVKSDKK